MKNLLVTGGANGLGEAVAVAAAAEGYRVGVLDRSMADAEKVAKKLANAVALEADVCDAQAVKQALGEFGQVDVLVNNAGILRTGPLIDHSVEDFRLVMDVNLNAVFIVAQAVARRMRDSGGGAIVNLSSINGIHPSPACGAYAAAKAGVIGLTQHMSLEWGEYGIRVNAVAPGFIDAGMSAPFLAEPDVRERRSSAVPIGRLGTAEDVAQTILYLGSDAASYVSGQTIAIDGGVINSVLQHLPRD